MKTLDSLKSLGYDVRINEGNIKLSYKGEGMPDESRVLPLLHELKANKNEIIKVLQKGENISDEALQDLFLETMDRINDEYLAGTVKYIQEHHKDLDDEVNKADDRINEVWQKCNNGEASIVDFRNALSSYENLYSKSIELFRNQLEDKSGRLNYDFFCLDCRPHDF